MLTMFEIGTVEASITIPNFTHETFPIFEVHKILMENKPSGSIISPTHSTANNMVCSFSVSESTPACDWREHTVFRCNRSITICKNSYLVVHANIALGENITGPGMLVIAGNKPVWLDGDNNSITNLKIDNKLVNIKGNIIIEGMLDIVCNASLVLNNFNIVLQPHAICNNIQGRIVENGSGRIIRLNYKPMPLVTTTPNENPTLNTALTFEPVQKPIEKIDMKFREITKFYSPPTISPPIPPPG